MLLVGLHLRGQREMLEPRDALLLHPHAGVARRPRHHVLSGGVAGGVVEAQPAHLADRVLLDVAQLAAGRRLLGLGLDGGEVRRHPFAEGARGTRVGKHEQRRALHRVVEHGGADAAGLAAQTHAARVARHQRALGGGHGHVELALGMLAVHEHRTGQPDRHLRDADEVLDVAGQNGRVERVTSDMRERGAGLGRDDIAARLGHVARVVVVLVAGQLDHVASCWVASLRSETAT
jgi:hypothetical protein